MRAVRSILNSSGPLTELLIVGQGASGDVGRSLSWVRDARLRFLHRKEPGKSAAINLGIACAVGDLIALTDDDCVVAPDWLGRICQVFGEHPNCAAVVGPIAAFGRGPSPYHLAPQTVCWKRPRAMRAAGLWKGFGGNTTWRRRSLRRIHGYDARIGPGSRVGGAGDWEALYRVLVAGMAVRYDPTVRVWHDGWETNDTREAKAKRYDCASMAAHIKCWWEVGGPALRDMAGVTLRHLFVGLKHLACRRRGTARSCFVKVGHYLSGVPLGLRLAREGKQEDGRG